MGVEVFNVPGEQKKTCTRRKCEPILLMHDLGPFLFKAAHKRPKYLHFVLQKNCHSWFFTEVIYFDLTLPWGKKHYNSQFVGESIKQQHCYGSALPLLSKATLGKKSTPKFLPSECPFSWVHLNSGKGPNCRSFTLVFLSSI